MVKDGPTDSPAKLRKKAPRTAEFAGLAELALLAELAGMVTLILLMASFQGSVNKDQLRSVLLTTSIVLQRNLIICKRHALGPVNVCTV